MDGMICHKHNDVLFITIFGTRMKNHTTKISLDNELYEEERKKRL